VESPSVATGITTGRSQINLKKIKLRMESSLYLFMGNYR